MVGSTSAETCIEDVPSTKKYADACVQTTPVVSATHFSGNNGTELQEDMRSPSLLTANLSGDKSKNFELVLGAAPPRPRTPLKTICRNTLAFAQPSRFSTTVLQGSSKRRIVSLPTKVGVDSIQEERTRSILIGTRSVSMPGAYRHFATFDATRQDVVKSRNSPSFSVELEGDSHIHTSLRSSGLPETPSPPSSPDSIVIIENSLHLPETFLHSKHKPPADTMDWQPWSSSPPRPIPALHGPASLPYARCPSGAEGTVLEEPSTVPGLIWGLPEEINAEGNLAQFPSIVDDHAAGYRKSIDRPTQRDDNIFGGIRSSPTDGLVDDLKCLQIQGETLRQSTPQQETADTSDYTYNGLYSDKLNEGAAAVGGTTMPCAQGSRQMRGAKLRTTCAIDAVSSIGEYTELNASAPAFIPHSVIRNPSNARLQTSCAPQMKDLGSSRSNARGLPPYYGSQPIPSTDSSPLWSEASPYLVTPPLHIPSVVPISSPGSNLRSSVLPLGHDSAFEQLKQLVQYKENMELLNYLHQNLQTESVTSLQITSPDLDRQPETTCNLSSSRPRMPINLHDLVATRTPIFQEPPTFTPVLSSAPTLPNAFLPVTASFTQVGRQTTNTMVPALTTINTSVNLLISQRKSALDSMITGQRYPRSIPLARMLERRLASVPEETSNVINETSASLHTSYEVQALLSNDKDSNSTKSIEIKHNNEEPALASGGQSRIEAKMSLQGVGRPDKARYKGKNTYAKGRAMRKDSDTSAEPENVGPKGRPAPYKKSKHRQGENAGKSNASK